MATTDLTLNTVLELASHEGLFVETYKDSVGVKTWSVGITGSDKAYNVNDYVGKPTSVDFALHAYLDVLRPYVKEVLTAFAGYPLKEHEFAAAVSFHYNTGSIARATWVAQVKAGKRDLARASIMQWNKPKEIVGRRTKERDLFFDAKWTNDGSMTYYTKVNPRTLAPIWSSAKRLEVRDVFADLLAVPKPAAPPAPTPLPDKVVAIDYPVEVPAAPAYSLTDRVKAFFAQLFS